MAVAGGAAIVAAAAATVGLASPALADATLNYTCTGTIGSTAVNFDPSAATVGSVSSAPKVGDSVSLGGFQTTMTATVPALQALGVTHVSGAFSSLAVTATNGGDAGSAVPSDLAIDSDVDATGALTLTTPGAPETLSGFTANAEGPMDFGLGAFEATLNLTTADGTDAGSVTVDCTGGGTFATVDVAPADTGGGGTGTGGAGGGNGGGGGTPTSGPTTGPTHTPSRAPVHAPSMTSTTSTQDVTSARGTLASTGAPYVIPMSASGAALVLLGAGMLIIGRRRRADGLTDGLGDEVTVSDD